MSVFTLVSGGRTRCDAAWQSRGWCEEDAHKLYVIHGGSGRYAIPGDAIELRPGHIYFIPGGRPHRFGGASGMEVSWLHGHCISPAVRHRLAACRRIAVWPLAAWAWWRPAWEAIPAWLAERDLASELRLTALLTAACAAAIAAGAPDDGLDPRIAAAQRWMEANCLAHPGLAAAARAAGLAPAVFQRRFTAVAGCSPRAWMEARRLEHACRLLREPRTSVQEVAAACGYANPFHFSRVVRRRLGASPRALRVRWAEASP